MTRPERCGYVDDGRRGARDRWMEWTQAPDPREGARWRARGGSRCRTVCRSGGRGRSYHLRSVRPSCSMLRTATGEVLESGASAATRSHVERIGREFLRARPAAVDERARRSTSSDPVRGWSGSRSGGEPTTRSKAAAVTDPVPGCSVSPRRGSMCSWRHIVLRGGTRGRAFPSVGHEDGCEEPASLAAVPRGTMDLSRRIGRSSPPDQPARRLAVPRGTSGRSAPAVPRGT